MADKAPPADASHTLGQIIDHTQKRDAIHLAVIPAQAAHRLYVGQDVGLDSTGQASTAVKPTLGIVDPFLRRAVEAGEWFWLVVYPRTITSLRHVWSHPAFSDEPQALPQQAVSDKGVRGLVLTGAAFDALHPAEIVPPASPVPTDAERKAASEAWLRSFVDGADCPSYEEVVAEALRHQSGGGWSDEYLHFDGSDAHGSIPAEFWDHIAIVTGRPVTRRAEFFSCSC